VAPAVLALLDQQVGAGELAPWAMLFCFADGAALPLVRSGSLRCAVSALNASRPRPLVRLSSSLHSSGSSSDEKKPRLACGAGLEVALFEIRQALLVRVRFSVSGRGSTRPLGGDVIHSDHAAISLSPGPGRLVLFFSSLRGLDSSLIETHTRQPHGACVCAPSRHRRTGSDLPRIARPASRVR